MKKKKDYQFGKNQKKANNEGKDVLPSKEQIKKNLKEINKKFLELVPQKRIIKKYGKPIPIKDNMIEQVTKDFGGSAKHKTKEYILKSFVELIDKHFLFSKCEEEQKEYEEAYREISPGDDVGKLMDTLYRFSCIKENWDTKTLKEEGVSDEILKANLYNACMIDCIGVYNCYANSLCQEEDDDIMGLAKMMSIMIEDDFQNKTVENAEYITAFIGGCALTVCKIHNDYCIKMNRYDCFTLFC